jgi:hypothetical protein
MLSILEDTAARFIPFNLCRELGIPYEQNMGVFQCESDVDADDDDNVAWIHPSRKLDAAFLQRRPTLVVRPVADPTYQSSIDPSTQGEISLLVHWHSLYGTSQRITIFLSSRVDRIPIRYCQIAKMRGYENLGTFVPGDHGTLVEVPGNRPIHTLGWNSGQVVVIQELHDFMLTAHYDSTSSPGYTIRLARESKVNGIADAIADASRSKLYPAPRCVCVDENGKFRKLPPNALLLDCHLEQDATVIVSRKPLVTDFLTLQVARFQREADPVEILASDDITVRELAEMFVFGDRAIVPLSYEIYQQKAGRSQRIPSQSTLVDAGVSDGDLVIVRPMAQGEASPEPPGEPAATRNVSRGATLPARGRSRGPSQRS